MANTNLARARLALSHSPFVALRGLFVEQTGNSLIISGRVDSYYKKQLAQEAIRAVCHGVELRNAVAVDKASAVESS